MSNDPIRGKSLRFRFSDGPMAQKTFEHSFADDGTVTFQMAGTAGAEAKASGDPAESAKSSIKYEVAAIREDVYAIAYVSKGYTLTTIVDFKTHKLVAFSSNDKAVTLQHGTFETAESSRPGGTVGRASDARPH